jgi:hypothetical protein
MSRPDGNNTIRSGNGTIAEIVLEMRKSAKMPLDKMINFVINQIVLRNVLVIFIRHIAIFAAVRPALPFGLRYGRLYFFERSSGIRIGISRMIVRVGFPSERAAQWIGIVRINRTSRALRLSFLCS